MNEEYRIAFSEVDAIIKIMPSTLSNKIPFKLREIIAKEKSLNYIPNNISQPLENCELTKKTTILISLIYRDFLCSKEEKEQLIEKQKKCLEDYEKELSQKYNTDNLFKRKNTQDKNKTQEICEEKSIAIIQEKKWYRKIFSIIKNIFKKIDRVGRD